MQDLHACTCVRACVPPVLMYGWMCGAQVVRGINSPYNVVDPDVRGISDWERLNLALPAVRRRIASPKIPVLERLPADGATLTPLTPPQQAKGTML